MSATFYKHLFLLILAIMCSCCSINVSDRKCTLREKDVVLTFDDGPNSSFSTTTRLLEVLQRHKTRAYFCCMGINAQNSPDILRNIAKNGHCIVNHSWSDKSIIFKSKSEIKAEIEQTRSLFKELVGDSLTINLYRPPYGIYRPSTKALFKAECVSIMPVSFYALDAEVKPDNTNLVNKLIWKYLNRYKRAILVLHDGKDSFQKMNKALSRDTISVYNRSWIPEFTDSLLTRLEREGYTIRMLD